MHVLLLHQLFVLGRKAGGTRHLELARQLAARGDRVTVIAPTTSYLTGATVGAAAERVEVEPGIGLVRVGSVRGSARFAGRLASFLSFTATSLRAALRVPEVDVVWGTSPPLFQALSAWAAARLSQSQS